MSKHSLEQLEALEQASINNRSAVETQQREGGFVACYCCIAFLPATEVNQYCHYEEAKEKTAICPRCGVDSILAVAVSMSTLQELYDTYFVITG